MARFLAIDWDHQQLHVIAATVTGSRVTVQKAVSWPEPTAPNPATAADLGKRLRERLRSEGIAPAPVFACVGRDRVIPKDVRHPAVGPADEPILVRMQVVKELTDAPDEVVIDYTPTGQGNSPTERRSLALIIRKELLDAYQAMCNAAGLKLAALTPRMFGIAACFDRLRATPLLVPPAPQDAVVAVVAMGIAPPGVAVPPGTPATGGWAEFTVLQGSKLVYARSMSVGANLAGEIRRNLAVYAGQFSQSPVTALYISGAGEHLDLQQRLQGMVPVPVALCDPFGPVDRPNLPTTGRSGFSGALGLIYLEASPADLPINFVKPKQPVVQRDPNRRLYVMVACLVGLIVAGGVGFLVWRNIDTDNRIRALDAERRKLDQAIAQLDTDQKKFERIDEWVKGEVVWLDEMYDLTDRFNESRSMRLTQLMGTPLPRTTKSDLIAKMTLKGVVSEDAKVVDTMVNEMVRDNHYRVSPKKLDTNRGSGRPEGFVQSFTVVVENKQQPPEKYVRKMPDPKPVVPQKRVIPRGGGGGPGGGGPGGGGPGGGFPGGFPGGFGPGGFGDFGGPP